MGDGGVVRLPTSEDATQVWHLAAIKKYHIDKKYGFTLKLVPAATPQMTATAIQSGSGDIAIFQFLDIARLRKTGLDIVGVGPFLEWGADHFIVPADSKVRDLCDFKGKKIGIYSRTSLDWILDVATFHNVCHLDVAKDIVVQEGAVGLLRGLIETGRLDGAHMYNNLTPAIVATGKARILYQMKEPIKKLGLPRIPFLFYSVTKAYRTAHPQNVRAFLAAYREAVDELRAKDDVWQEHGKELKMTPKAIDLLRDEMREDLWTRFQPTTEADMKTVFNFVLKEAGPKALGGLTEFPEGFMTREYQ